MVLVNGFQVEPHNEVHQPHPLPFVASAEHLQHRVETANRQIVVLEVFKPSQIRRKQLTIRAVRLGSNHVLDYGGEPEAEIPEEEHVGEKLTFKVDFLRNGNPMFWSVIKNPTIYLQILIQNREHHLIIKHVVRKFALKLLHFVIRSRLLPAAHLANEPLQSRLLFVAG